MHQRPHQKLITWRESYALCLWIYKITADFPSYERSGLASQMRSAAYGIPIHIAEGNAKRSPKEKECYFERSHASLEELHCQIQLAGDLDYMSERQLTKADHQMQRISFLLMRLRKAVIERAGESKTSKHSDE